MNSLEHLRAGESHGKYLVGILEGFPAGLSINHEFILDELKLRKSFIGRGLRSEEEVDEVEFTSGLRGGTTTGGPISFIIKNKFREEFDKKVFCPRPGHADLCGYIKYKYQDIRDVIELSSARETAVRTVIGALCKLFLKEFGIEIISHVIQIGDVVSSFGRRESFKYDKDFFYLIKEKAIYSKLRCADKNAEEGMLSIIEKAREKGDTIGGIFEVIAINLLPGLGGYTQWYRRLDAKIAYALMSIPAVKGVEIGLGFSVADKFGSQVHDEIFYSQEQGYYRNTNRAGGIEGGISNGEPIVIRCAVKPIPTLRNPLRSVDIRTKEISYGLYERSDVCVVASAGVVGEEMLAFVLADTILQNFYADHIDDIKTRVEAAKASIFKDM